MLIGLRPYRGWRVWSVGDQRFVRQWGGETFVTMNKDTARAMVKWLEERDRSAKTIAEQLKRKAMTNARVH